MPSILDLVAVVLAWASSPDVVLARPHFRGEALDLRSLLAPPPSLVSAAGALASLHAARLGLRAPPLGQTLPFGAGPFLLAAAIGLVDKPDLADAVAVACPPPRGAWDLVLRDALVGRALRESELDVDLADTLRVRSPLSAVLDRPAPGGEDEVIAVIDELCAHPDGRRVVVHAFARPLAAPNVRRFRASVMDRLRLRAKGPAGPDFVLEVYEAAVVFHGERIRAELAEARRVVFRNEPDLEALERAFALASYWGPLARIRRASPETLRARVCLELDVVLEASRLHELATRLLGEAA